MLWTILCDSLNFVAVWDCLSGYTMGGLIHILLVIAIIVVVVRLIQGRKMIVAIWTLAGEGEVFGKEVVSRSRKILPKSYDTFSRKGLAINHFTIKLTERSNRYEKEKYRYPLFSASYADHHLCGLCIDTHT